MTRADAIKTIREALEDARDAINTNYTNCSMNYYADQCDTALAALDSLATDPSEVYPTAMDLVLAINQLFCSYTVRNGVQLKPQDEAAALIEADRERIRRTAEQERDRLREAIATYRHNGCTSMASAIRNNASREILLATLDQWIIADNVILAALAIEASK